MAEPALRHRGQGQEDPSAAAPRVPETLPVWEGPKPPAAERKALLHRIVTAKWLQRTVGGILLFILAFSFWISQLDAQGMMLEIMVCEKALFKELNITFYIDEGTLLGAVRDGGFFDEADREDTDWSILQSDTDRLYSLRHLSRERCGFPMVHRSDRQYLPYWLPLVCRRSAFRVFYGYMYPYFYLDIRDYDIVDGKLIDLHNVADLDTGNFPLEKIFPLKTCNFSGVEFPCPNNSTWVLEEEYGPTWTTRIRGFKTWELGRDYTQVAKKTTGGP